MAESYFRSSQAKFRQGDIEGGFSDLDQAIALAPTNLTYLWKRAREKYYKDVFTDAVHDLSEIIRLSSDMEEIADARFMRAISYSSLGQRDELLEDLNWLIENISASDSTYSWRASLMLEEGNTEAALEDYTIAIQLAPENDLHRLQRARIYYMLGNYEYAIQEASAIVSDDKNPSFLSIAYHWRGRSYYLLGKMEEALADFNAIMRIHGNPPYDDPSLYFNHTNS